MASLKPGATVPGPFPFPLFFCSFPPPLFTRRWAPPGSLMVPCVWESQTTRTHRGEEEKEHGPGAAAREQGPMRPQLQRVPCSPPCWLREPPPRAWTGTGVTGALGPSQALPTHSPESGRRPLLCGGRGVTGLCGAQNGAWDRFPLPPFFLSRVHIKVLGLFPFYSRRTEGVGSLSGPQP